MNNQLNFDFFHEEPDSEPVDVLRRTLFKRLGMMNKEMLALKEEVCQLRLELEQNRSFSQNR